METISVINSVQIPPWLTKEINTNGLESAKEILLAVRAKSIAEIEAQAKEENTTAEALLDDLEEDDEIPYSNLLRHLFDWASLPKTIPSCVSLATSAEAHELHKQLHEAIAPPAREPRGTSRLQRRRSSLSGIAADLNQVQRQ